MWSVSEAAKGLESGLGHVFGSQCDSILCHDGLSGRSVRSDEDTVSHFEAVDRFFLEVVQLEWVLDVSCARLKKKS
jgi:hypothetical protein